MTAAIILYGSQARGDAGESSDIDVVLSEPRGDPMPPKFINGMSVHFYSQDWLKKMARRGHLFTVHIAMEGRGVWDPSDFMHSLRKNVRLKSSYGYEKQTAAATIELLTSRNWHSDTRLRQRYFWALRTIGAAISAEQGKPEFGNVAMERVLGVSGLSSHIAARDRADYEICQEYGRQVLARNGLATTLSTKGLIDFLLKRGEIGLSTVQLFEFQDVQEFSGSIYA